MDLIKASMPEYQAAIQAGDPTAADKVHVESASLAAQQLKEAIQAGTNFIYDSTGSRKDITIDYMKAAAKKGMKVELLFIATTVENCLERAHLRGQKTGRFVPDDVIESSHYFSQMNFDDLIDYAHKWKVFNNDHSSFEFVFSSKEYEMLNNNVDILS